MATLQEVKTLLTQQKTAVATAVTNKGTDTFPTDSFTKIANNILNIGKVNVPVENCVSNIGMVVLKDQPDKMFDVYQREVKGDYSVIQFREVVPAEIVFGATVGDNTLHLRSQNNGFNCTINWGDGTTTVAPVNGGNVIHSYATAGDYSIKISGNSFAGFNVNGQAGKEKYKELVSMGKWEIDTMTTCIWSFKKCSNLTKIHADAFKYVTKITSFFDCFIYCSSLTEIPEGLFANNTAVTTFTECFHSCYSLTTIPEGLFANNTAVTTFSACFHSCSSLTTIPEGLFANNTAVTNFSYCFYSCIKLTLNNSIFGTDYTNRFLNKSVNFSSCFERTSFTGTKGTAPELWNFNFGTGTPTKTGCFAGAGNSATSLTNYDIIPKDWGGIYEPPIPAEIVFSATAGDNTLHLRTQTNGFDCTINWGDGTTTQCPVNGGDVVHNYATAGDYRIKISGKSFAGFSVGNRTGREKYKELISVGKWTIDTMTTCKNAFWGCFALEVIHADAFKYATEVTSFDNGFDYCTKITHLPEGLFDNNTKVTSFNSCFSSCSSLTTIPTGLFDNNTKVTDFTSCFDACSSLTTIPEGLFANNTLVTSFNSCFSSCTKLTVIPTGLFDNNTKVTTFSNCFSYCYYLITIPENLFANNTDAVDFSLCFYNCITLTLNNSVFGTNYSNRFLNKEVRFYGCFAVELFSGVQGTAPELWNFDYGTGVPTKTSCYYGHNSSSLTNYNDIPAEWTILEEKLGDDIFGSLVRIDY